VCTLIDVVFLSPPTPGKEIPSFGRLLEANCHWVWRVIFAASPSALLRSDPADFVHALGEELFAAFGGGVVPGAPGEAFGEAVHVGDAALFVVGVLVSLAYPMDFIRPVGRCAGAAGRARRGWFRRRIRLRSGRLI
jgi:hypothetical protein